MARGSAGVSVLHRHLRVLDAFDALHPFLGLGEIAEAAGLPLSTTHRLVAELEREGLLERESDRTYRLGVRLWELASRTPGALGLREMARPWLAAVHGRVRQHTQLGVRAGTDVLFLERMSTPGAVVNATLIGGRIPLHASSAGLVLLAEAGEQAVDAVVRAGLRRYTDATIANADALRAALRAVRADGFAVTDGHIHPESRGVAVPVRGPDGSVYAALSVVVANDGTSARGIVEALSVAAAGISRSLADAYGPGHAGPAIPGVSARSTEYIASLEDLRRPAPVDPDGRRSTS